MVDEVTIDAAGRLVIPKPLRDKLRLVPGMRLRITEQQGRLVIDPDRTEPRLVERDGFLVVDLGTDVPAPSPLGPRIAVPPDPPGMGDVLDD